MGFMLARRSWAQAELAREVGVRSETLRKVLGELKAGGVPLDVEKDHPHVYWTLAKNWYPGGVLIRATARGSAVVSPQWLPPRHKRSQRARDLASKKGKPGESSRPNLRPPCSRAPFARSPG
jgi:hypothetical protein